MATLTIQLPPQRAQTEFNLRRWSELLADPELAKVEGRVETEKIALYFDAGALEVWVGSESGTMRFFHQGKAEPLSTSRICPHFPAQIELRPA